MAWKMERDRLKEEFKAMGISYCEAMVEPTKCWKTIGLGFAHAAKRRDLKEGELSKVILACQYCHQVLEYEMDAQEMREFVEDTIESRKSRVDIVI